MSSPAGSVDDAHPRLDLGEALLADEMPRLLAQRRMEAQVVGAGENLVESPEADLVGLGQCRRDERDRRR